MRPLRVPIKPLGIERDPWAQRPSDLGVPPLGPTMLDNLDVVFGGLPSAFGHTLMYMFLIS